MPRVVHLTTVHRLRDPRIFQKEVRSLRDAGYDAHLVVQHDATEPVDGVPVVGLPPRAGRIGRARLLPLAYRRAAELEAELYHIHDPELIPVAWLLKRRLGARVVYDMHEYNAARRGLDGPLLRALESWCFRWVDHVVLAEDGYAERLRGREVEATTVLNYYRAHGDEPTRPRPAPEGSLTLVCAGVQGQARGMGHMLDLVGAGRRRGLDLRLVVAGVCYRTDERAYWPREIERRGLADAVRLVGWSEYVDHDRVRAVLASEAHVGVALFEPLENFARSIPTKFYEYLNYGLPILASDLPVWRGFIDEWRCGAAVSPGDAEAALDWLEAWARDPDAYVEASERALAIAPRFRWRVMAERLVDTYGRLLGAPAPRP